MSHWKWGKAGVRRDERDRVRRAAELARQRAADAESHRVATAEARRLYEAGQLAPWKITLCLDAKELFGPEVDEACGAAEPDVDLWEAGVLYPTWEQVEKLAELAGVTVRFLMHDYRDGGPPSVHRTSMRFHEYIPPGEDLVARFTPEAIRDRLRPLGQR